MVNRLSPEDAMYYFLDGAGTTTHLGALLILDPAADDGHPTLDYAGLVALVENRLQLAPRYRQVVTEVTLGLARPVWVDDREFDINFHVRLSGLPQPGADEQLQELIARVMSRPLDRTRPLWEMYLIEGLAGGRVAILTKSHRCLVNDPEHREISEVICDETADVPSMPDDIWMAGRPPGIRSLTLGAVAEMMARPGELVDSLVRGNGPVADVWSLADRGVRMVGGAVAGLTSSAPSSPLNSMSTASRLITYASVPRGDCQRIAIRFECTLNDVVLAIVTGVMRRWTLSIQDSVGHSETVRVILPLGARDPVAEGDGVGNWMSEAETEFVTDLPVGEDAPAVRLMQVAGLADRNSQSSRRMSPGMRPMFPELGVVPFAEKSARAFSGLFQRAYNVPIAIGTPQIAQRFVAGMPVRQIFTLPTLISQRALAISVNEYVDELQFGFVADRSVVGDLPAMADYTRESFEELLTGGLGTDPRRRGRK